MTRLCMLTPVCQPVVPPQSLTPSAATFSLSGDSISWRTVHLYIPKKLEVARGVFGLGPKAFHSCDVVSTDPSAGIEASTSPSEMTPSRTSSTGLAPRPGTEVLPMCSRTAPARGTEARKWSATRKNCRGHFKRQGRWTNSLQPTEHEDCAEPSSSDERENQQHRPLPSLLRHRAAGADCVHGLAALAVHRLRRNVRANLPA